MDTTPTLPPEVELARLPAVRTTIHTAPRSRVGKLLRLAAEFMPTVTVGETGWVQEVIENALTFYIETKVRELPREAPDPEADIDWGN